MISIASLARAACDARLNYWIIRGECLLRQPKSDEDVGQMVRRYGLIRDENTWKCESPEGTLLVVLLGRDVHLEFTPAKREAIPDGLLSALSKDGDVMFVGPSAVRISVKSRKLKESVATEVEELITVSLGGGYHEDTQCTIKYGPGK